MMIITFYIKIQSHNQEHIHFVLKSQKLSVVVHKWSFYYIILYYLLMYIISIFISIKPYLIEFL